MSFTRALYYPTIDIGNWDWAKSTALLWDNIQTIVPQSIQNPYQNRVTQILFDEGVLNPLYINPEMELVTNLTSEVETYLKTNEGYDYLVKGTGEWEVVHGEKMPEKITRIHREKLPRELSLLSKIHPEKMSNEVQSILRENILDDGWVMVDRRFARFYMSLLANKICQEQRFVLLTDDALASNLTDKARLDNQLQIFKNDYEYREARNTMNLSEGLLANLILKGIRFSPDTDVLDIIRFKRRYQDELGRFRNNLTKLVKDIPTGNSYDEIYQQIQDIYVNEFIPSYNDFKNALDGARLKWVNDNFMKVSFFSMGATALPTYLAGASVPHALIAGAGLSLITSIVSYNLDKKERLRNSPFSYLYSCENRLSRDDFDTLLRNRAF